MEVNFDLAAIDNLDIADFEIISNNDLSEADEKAIMGASCTTCTCCCSCCSI